MSKDTDQIVVGANGTIRIAPTTATMPEDIAEAYSVDWVDLGYTDENGAKIVDGKTVEAIKVWQLFYAARKIITERDFTVAFTLRQFAAEQVELAFGGGAVTATDTGYRYDPPSPEDIDERALALDWVDGDKSYRLVIPRGMVTDNVETTVVRTGPSDLPITFGVLGEDGVTPWYFLTDDASFADLVAGS